MIKQVNILTIPIILLAIFTGYGCAGGGISAEATISVSWRCLLLPLYGENSEETELLRNFRDNVLSKTPEGQELIRLYYEWSPTIVKVMEKDEEFKKQVKEMVDGILPLIREAIE